MPEFIVRFSGVTRGALGIRERQTVTVSAETPKQAILACYETHEHISGPCVYRRALDGEIVTVQIGWGDA